MKNFIFFGTTILLLILNDYIYSQTCVWPGEQYTEENPGCHPGVINATVTGGTLEHNGSQSITITWDDTPTGSADIRIACDDGPNNYSIYVVKILDYVKSLSFLDPEEKSVTTLLANTTYIINTDIAGSPTIISWTITKPDGTLIVDLHASGETSPSFVPSAYSDLREYIGTTDNLKMKVVSNNGCGDMQVEKLFTIQQDKPSAITYTPPLTTCTGSKDAKFEINSITIDGIQYPNTETNYLPEKIRVTIYSYDPNTEPYVFYFIETLDFDSNSGFPLILSPVNFGKDSYKCQIERYFGDDPSAIAYEEYFTVEDGPTLNLGFSAPTPDCSNSNATVTLTGDINVANYSYSYLYGTNGSITVNTDNTVNISSTQNGGYFQAQHNTVTSCVYKNTTAVSVIFPSPISLTSGPTPQDATCNGGSNGSITLSATGGTGPETLQFRKKLATEDNFTESFVSGNISGQYTFTGLAKGNYKIEIQQANGLCSLPIPDIIPIGSPDALTLINPSSENITNPTSCSTSSPGGSITISATGGGSNNSGNVTFTLYGEGDQSVEEKSAPIGTACSVKFEGLSDQNYYITASDKCDLPKSDKITLTIDHPRMIQADKVDATCNNEEGQIILKSFQYGTNTYKNNTGEDLTPFTFYLDGNEQTGHPFTYDVPHKNNGSTYKFKIVDNKGCSSEEVSLNPDEPDMISLNADQPKASCIDKDNGAITISAINGNTKPDAERTFYLYNGGNDSEWLKKEPGTKVETTDGIITYSAKFEGYPAADYYVKVEDNCDNKGLDIVKYITIGNYNQIELVEEIETTQMSCTDIKDGQILITATRDEISQLYFHLSTENDTLLGETSDNIVYHYLFNDTIYDKKGGYNIVVSDEHECEVKFDVSPIFNPPPLQILSIDTTNVTCWKGTDGTISLSATGGTGDIWFDIDDRDSVVGNQDETDYAYVYTGLGEGSHTIQIYDDNLCSLETPQLVELNTITPYLVNTLTPTGTQCHGGTDGSIFVKAEGGTAGNNTYTYQLFNETTGAVVPFSDKSESAEFKNIGYGNYHVNIFDDRHCPLVSNSITVNQPAELEVEKLMTSASCYDAENVKIEANVSGGTPGHTYYWYNDLDEGFGTSNTINVASGTYFVDIRDANNCGFGQPTVGQPSVPVRFTVSVPDTIKVWVENLQKVDSFGLSNGSVTLQSNDGWSDHQYSIDGTNFRGSPQFNGLSAGTYTFYVKDGSGCLNSVSGTMVQPDPFLVEINNISNVNCFGGSDGQIVMKATGGWRPYIYTLTDEDGTTYTQLNDSVFTNLPTGTYTVSAGYLSYKHLINNALVSQPLSALISEITSSQNSRCAVADGTVTVTASGGTTPYYYTWNNSQTTATATGLASGTYSVVVTDFNNCTTSSEKTIYNTDGAQLSVNQINNLPCFDSDNVGSITLDVTGGAAPYTIQWDDPASQTGTTANNLAVGTYSANITDGDGCTSKIENLEITVPSELLLSFDDFTDPRCFGNANGSITATATGGTPPYTYNWQNIAGAGNTSIVSNLPAGVYSLLLNDNNNCQTSGNFELKEPAAININLVDSVFLCAGQTATLDAGNPGLLYNWTSNNGFSSDKQTIYVSEDGDYTVTVSNIQGCSSTKKVNLKHENRQFDADFLMAPKGSLTDTVVVIDISWPMPDSLTWTIPDNLMKLVDGDAYKELIPLETGEYTIGIKAYMAGCEDIVEKTITIIPGDGLKLLKAEGVSLIKKARLFPNPNTGEFEVEVELSETADIRADVFSMSGLRMMPTKNDYGKKDYLIGFNLVRMQPGVYFVNISAGDEVRKLKFVVN